MKIARNILVLAFIGFIFFGAFAPKLANTQAETVKITFWYTENDAEAPGVEQLINQFMDMYPNITVVAEQKGFFTAKNTYIVQFTGGLEPTVFRAARDWVVEFAYQGMIQPVEDYFTQEDLNDFLPDALRLVRYNDKEGNEHIYGFPQLVDAPALFFNKHLLEQAGINTSKITPETSWTWDEFVNNAKKVYQDSDADWGFTLQGMFYGGQPIYYGHGAEFFANGTVSRDTIIVDNEASRKALEFLKSVVDAEWTPSWDLQGWETINQYFTTGKVGIIQQGPWELRNFLTSSPEFNPELPDAKPYASEDNLGIMQLPRDEEGHQGAPLGGHAYVISKRASGDVLSAAVKFAKFMSSPEAMKLRAMNYYHVPARQSVFEDPDVQASDAWKYIQVFEKIVKNAYKVPVHHLWAQLEGVFAEELDAYLANEQSLDAMLQRVIALWNEILPATGERGEKETPFSMWPFIIAFAMAPIIIKKRRKRRI